MDDRPDLDLLDASAAPAEDPSQESPAGEPGTGYRRPGLRTQRRRAIERARRRRAVAAMAAATAIVAGIAVVVGLVRGGARSPSPPAGDGSPPAGPRQETWLLIGTVEADASGAADWLSVVSWDPAARKGFMMYVPRSTFAEVPGYGQETLANAMGLGREPLALLTASNLLGVRFDHHLKISDQAAQALFDKLEGITIEVDRRLTRTGSEGRSQVVFAEGRQHLDGRRVAEYLGFVEESGDELSRGVRHALVWSALFGRFRDAGSPQDLGRVFAEAMDLFGTDAGAGQLQQFFGTLASVPASEVHFETMPVRATGIDTGHQLYAPDREAVESMVRQYLAGSRPTGAGEAGRRIEILNGNGRPGIGQEVADLLIPKGFRVILNQNAKSFDYDGTQIVIYSDSKRALAIADEIRTALGVGEVVVSRQRQSIVDVTIVVGRDYLESKR